MRVPRALFVLLTLVRSACGEETFPTFREQVLDPEIGRVCYAVTLADVDGDGKTDVVAVTENRVFWYRNPDWKKRTIIENRTPPDNVCIDPYDITGDGRINFALGAGWTRTGTIHWLERGESLDETWTVHDIGEERWLHRMRFADVLGRGRAQLVISPLNATVGEGVRLTALEIPNDPVKDRWRTTVMDRELNRMHNHWHVDFDGNGEIDTLTASREGVHLIRRENGQWSRTRIGTGAVADESNMRGAGEVKTGRLKNGTMFVATVEPMHGSLVAVYLPPENGGKLWRRQVIDEGFERGHALWTADLDGDGSDEIVFGHSDTPETFGVIAYDCRNEEGTEWTRHVIDAGGMATEDLIVGDLTGNGRPDIVAGGRATRNLKLYINTP